MSEKSVRVDVASFVAWKGYNCANGRAEESQESERNLGGSGVIRGWNCGRGHVNQLTMANCLGLSYSNPVGLIYNSLFPRLNDPHPH